MRKPTRIPFLFASIVIAAAVTAPVEAPAGTLQEDVTTVAADLRSGRATFTFDARDDVRGNCRNLFTGQFGDGSNRHDYENGPVRVTLDIDEGRVAGLETSVGCPFSADRKSRDLGHRAVSEAVDYLLDLADHGTRRVARDAIFPATIGRDAVTWPRLLDIARNDNRPSEVREQAVFWLGQAAGDKVAGELGRLIDEDDQDIEVREQAVFAVSQRDPDEAVPILIRLIHGSPRPEIRRKALFWLAQVDDPRVLPVFEEILTGD